MTDSIANAKATLLSEGVTVRAIRFFAPAKFRTGNRPSRMARTIRTRKQLISVVLSGLGLIGALLSATAQSNPNSGAATPPQKEEVLNNAAIIDLKQLGLTESVTVEKIKTSVCNFDMSLRACLKTH